MTHTEVITILRQFNEWQKGDGPLDYSPNGLINAIDAAIEMIERLESAEKGRDALRVKIEVMKGHPPYVSIDKILTEVMDIAAANGADSRSMPDEYVEVAAWLCGIPGAQPTPSVSPEPRPSGCGRQRSGGAGDGSGRNP